MTKPGFYHLKEGEPPTLGGTVYPPELANLPAGTRILLHSHLHGDRFQSLIHAARGDGNMLSIIRGRRKGKIISSAIVDNHSGHADVHPPVAMEYVVSLGESGPPRHLGRPPEYQKNRQAPLPPWLAGKPVARTGRR